MDYNIIKQKQSILVKNGFDINGKKFENYHDNFKIEYAHHSTAIEGNTLTLIETKMLLDDGISVGGKKLREIYEVVNHNKAYEYILSEINGNKDLDENIVKNTHQIVMENIRPGGFYRNEEVRISGAGHVPPAGMKMFNQIKNFYYLLNSQEYKNPIEKAAWTHAEFVRIHPFIDGNGRTSRLMMNYQLIRSGLLPISIKAENRLDYYNTLEEYAMKQNLDPFMDMIYDLENNQLDEVIKNQGYDNNIEKSPDVSDQTKITDFFLKKAYSADLKDDLEIER